MPSAPTVTAGSLDLAPRGDFTRQPTIKIEIAFGSAWDAAAPAWEDVTSLVRQRDGLTITGSGRPDETQRSSPSACTVVFSNRNRSLDPAYTGGPHGANVTPRHPVRVRGEWNTLIYPLFQGWTASWTPNYPSHAKDATVTLVCNDLFAILNIPFPDGTTFATADLPGTRIGACLDLIGFPAGLRNLDTGLSTMPALEEPSGTIIEHILAVADSDGGFFYTGPDGAATYETRSHRYLNETVSVATFGDLAPELIYYDIVPSSNDAYLFTQAQVTPGDGSAVATAEDATAVAQYGPIPFTKSLLTGFNEAQAAAESYVARYKDPAVRFLEVVIKSEGRPTTHWPVVLGSYNSRRYTFKMRPLGATVMTQDCYVERAEHIIQGGEWTTNWSLSPFGGEDPWQLDHGVPPSFPTGGILDTFNRANEGPPPAGWTVLGAPGMQIISNVLAPSAGLGVGIYYNTPYGPDVEAYITISTLPIAGGSAELIARFDASGNGYAIVYDASYGVRLDRFDAYAGTAIGGPYSVTLAAGDGFGIRCVGSTIEAWARVSGVWSRKGSAVDATYPGNTTDDIWLYHYGNGSTVARFDDFGGGPAGYVLGTNTYPTW